MDFLLGAWALITVLDIYGYYGWIFPPKFICWNPNPSTSECDCTWTQGLWIGDWVKMRPLRWPLIQSHWCPYKKLGHKEIPRMRGQRGKTMWGHGKAATWKPRTEASEDIGLANAYGWPWTSSFKNCEKIHFCCFSCPVHGIFLRQPKETDTADTQ